LVTKKKKLFATLLLCWYSEQEDFLHIEFLIFQRFQVHCQLQKPEADLVREEQKKKKKHSLAIAKPILAWPCLFHKGLGEAKEGGDGRVVHLEVEYAKGVQ
jgi:hypothetical protein